MQGVARILICYFLNEGLTVVQTNPRIAMLLEALFDSDGAWTHHDGFVDSANLAGAVAAALCVADVQTPWCAGVMMGDTLVDCYRAALRIMWQWAYGRGLYINELMAKKFSCSAASASSSRSRCATATAARPSGCCSSARRR